VGRDVRRALVSLEGEFSRDLDMWVDGGESCCRDRVKQLLEDVGELIGMSMSMSDLSIF